MCLKYHNVLGLLAERGPDLKKTTSSHNRRQN